MIIITEVVTIPKTRTVNVTAVLNFIDLGVCGVYISVSLHKELKDFWKIERKISIFEKIKVFIKYLVLVQVYEIERNFFQFFKKEKRNWNIFIKNWKNFLSIPQKE